MSKGKINYNAKTKLSQLVVNKQQNNNSPNHGFITKDKTKKITKSFRLNVVDLEKLNHLVSEINKNTIYKNYNESEIIRGLILLSEKLPINKVIKSLEERGS